MKKLKLSQGKVALVDDEDYEWLNQWKWFAHKDCNTYYAGRSEKINGSRKQIWMHRAIMNTPVGLEVDHIDHNGLNNQRSNLRNCTQSQNHMNQSNMGKSKYKGVSFFTKKKYKQVRANICVCGSPIYLGSFLTEEEAALAYNEAAKKYFGEFALLNNV
jgi:hypothetical protein